MTRTVKNGMAVDCFVDDREEDTVRKAICEYAPNVPVPINDAK
jgi:hypothetical protein